MTVTETKVINETVEKITLKQGSAGVFSQLYTLQPKGAPGSSFIIKLESNTTYREYWCAQQPGPPSNEPRVIFSSDDCAEYKEVRIFEVKPAGSKKYTWEGTVPRVKSEGQADSAPAASHSLLKKFLGFFGWNK